MPVTTQAASLAELRYTYVYMAVYTAVYMRCCVFPNCQTIFNIFHIEALAQSIEPVQNASIY